ncbi:uncharacterized protein LOC112593381 [Melanaphis sacchari]|uniref:uncharacterized protein LOC112593381 n=1 Tax=Melanaphis sacchari TaxID=742174 RepID=UPI000DC14D6F|nr:uncharacterized protein LOC112593381 [Melanaphis sacchari]
MISYYKVLIILTFTIYVSRCDYTAEEIKNECDRCVDNLKVVGFIYSVPLINYALAMMDANYGFTSFNKSMKYMLNEDILNEQKDKYGDSVMEEHKIYEYIHAYYNECKSFEPRPPLLNEMEYCIEQNLPEIKKIPELIMVLKHT